MEASNNLLSRGVGGGTEFWGEGPGEMDGERGYLQGHSWILGAGRR